MHDTNLILTITIGLTFALVLGYITQRMGLSPIVGYLLAGLAIGPFTPGIVADPVITAQLAEIGVILLMFGVGLHFHWRDLLAVRSLALPGAIGQSLVATGLGVAVTAAFGWSLGAGVVLGIAISVASTVVLIRVLSDNRAVGTAAGHAAIGWLVVEDMLTIIVLVLLPPIVAASSGNGSLWQAMGVLGIALGKLALLVGVMIVAGSRVIPWLMHRVARSRSRELFTLTVLVVALGVATGSAWLFGASMALGAFLAGMAVAQSDVSHHAASDALPMRDAFAVLFFLSVGMLFDPMIFIHQAGLVLAVLGVILLAKPAAALLIVVFLGYPLRTALTVAVGLAQIGEFSFILSELGRSLKVLPESGHNVLVAAALLSISLNPLLFRHVPGMELWLNRHPRILALFTRWRKKRILPTLPTAPERALPRAVVVGYGPVGKMLTRMLEDFNIQPAIIDMNLDSVTSLRKAGLVAIYGDAGRREILEAAGIAQAEYLVVTLPEVMSRIPVIASARLLNPDLKILTRARYVNERLILEESGMTFAAYEETEVAVALARLLLREIGVNQDEIDAESTRLRSGWAG